MNTAINTVAQHSSQQTPKLTLDEISCGSSCSTVTSDDDKFFNPVKYIPLRKEKKLLHRQQKLLNRTGQTSAFSESKIEVKNCESKLPETEKNARLFKVNDQESSSPYESDDDFLWLIVEREKLAAKKARWMAKQDAQKESTIPPKAKSMQTSNQNMQGTSSGRLTRKAKPDLIIIDSDSD